MQRTTDKVTWLRARINDLVGLATLPALWNGGDPSDVLGPLLDGLFSVLRLDFAYARLRECELTRRRSRRPRVAPALGFTGMTAVEGLEAWTSWPTGRAARWTPSLGRQSVHTENPSFVTLECLRSELHEQFLLESEELWGS